MKNEALRGENLVPRFQVALPASLYVNGKQNPPIEADGEITSVSLSCLRVRSDSKIPIPSKGVLSFTLCGSRDLVEMNVDIIQRVDTPRSFWSWKSRPKYEFQLSIGINPKEIQERYERLIHGLIFGGFSEKTNWLPMVGQIEG